MMIGSLTKAYGYLRRGQKPDQIVGRFRGIRFVSRKQDWTAIKEVFLRDEYAALDKLFEPDSQPLIIDLGANIGCFALRAFIRAPLSKICSVEAAGDTSQVLRKNKELNPGLDWAVIQAAVWKDNQAVYLKRTNNSMGHQVKEHDTGEKVESLTLDQIFERMGWRKIDLIKIDIEGAEAQVVPNAGEVLSRTGNVLIEIHDDRIDSQPVLNKLTDEFPYCHRLGNRLSSKPVLLFSRHQYQL